MVLVLTSRCGGRNLYGTNYVSFIAWVEVVFSAILVLVTVDTVFVRGCILVSNSLAASRISRNKFTLGNTMSWEQLRQLSTVGEKRIRKLLCNTPGSIAFDSNRVVRRYSGTKHLGYMISWRKKKIRMSFRVQGNVDICKNLFSISSFFFFFKLMPSQLCYSYLLNLAYMPQVHVASLTPAPVVYLADRPRQCLDMDTHDLEAAK